MRNVEHNPSGEKKKPTNVYIYKSVLNFTQPDGHKDSHRTYQRSKPFPSFST